MKKLFAIFAATLLCVSMWAKEGGTLSSSPAAPIDPSTTVTLTYNGTGTNFANWEPKCFIHTWLVAADGETLSKSYGTAWVNCNGDADYNALENKVKMTLQSKGIYTISMNIKSFFGVADDDLAKIGKIGVIVRAQYSGDNNQTNDMFLSVKVATPEPPTPVDSMTVYFADMLDWGAANAYVWPTSGDPYKTWPGEAMTKTAEKAQGKDVYSYRFPASCVNVIFDHESTQTVNLAWSEAKPYFCPEKANSEGKITGTWYATAGEIPAPEVPVDPVKYYITGNWVSWNTTAIESTADTYVLKNLEAGAYELKITVDGSWETAKGYSELTTKPKGVTTNKDNNICFTLSTAGDVTVTYTSSVFTIEGDFYIKPVEKKMVKLVPSEEWASNYAQFAAWIWGKELEKDQWTSFFTPVSAGNDTLQAEIISSADSIIFVRFSPRASKPTWDKQEGGYEIYWGEMKTYIDYPSLVWTIVGWDKGQWEPVEKPCESFGLLIDDAVYKPAKKNVSQTGWLEYVLREVELTKGQTVQVRDDCNKTNWTIDKYAETSYEFEIQDDHYVVGESGKYDFYLKFILGNDEIFISKAGSYTTAVRDQCEDVLMQAFFNESYNNSAPGVSDSWNIGNTKWSTLLSQAEEIGRYFDLVWLPPSSSGDGMGYHPKEYSNQNSNWGTASELSSLIDALHNEGTKVVADVVINHCTGWTSWCDFPTLDFGEYGTFYPDASYICKDDEVNYDSSAGSCKGKATGSYDDGENWSGARDWAHNDVQVQEMFKAYLKWLHNVVGYDGFRYDKGDGFNNWHHDNYNRAAKPYIAFMECYSGTDEIQSRIAGANHNLMALDFDTKWHVFNSFAGWDYSRGRGDGLLGRNKGRYAIEFIDSHDWFLRSDNENEFGGRGNSLTETMKCRLLQANAFLLSMPGIPCVFYPHWVKYKGFLQPMIEARKAAGVHSESEVKDEYMSNTGYQATIVGKDDGYIILCLGDKAHQDFSSAGYTCMASFYKKNDCGQGHDASYQVWVHPRKSQGPATPVENMDVVPMKAEKLIMDGKLYIRLGDTMYDVLGQMIK